MTIRRATFALALGLAFSSYALPQEPAAAQKENAAEGDAMLGWKWANFAILALGLAYIIGKTVPAIFRKQSEEIQGALAEAAKIKEEAATYATGVESRLANLQREIEKLRQEAQADMAAEGERLLQETEHHLQRIREQSVQEVALMTRAAKDGLRKYAAELSIGLAEQRIRARMNPEAQDKLVNGFLQDLHKRVDPQAVSN